MMPKPFKLMVLLTKREPPSSRLRFRDAAGEFRRYGLESAFVPIPSGLLARLRLFYQAKSYDAVVIQKKTSFKGLELGLLRRSNANLVFDYDDAVMFHELEHHQPLSGKNFRKFLRTLKYCRAVVAGNSFLADFARPNCDRVYILPTPIDTARYRVIETGSSPAHRLTVGWIGTPGGFFYLKAIAPAFQALAARYPEMELKIISSEPLELLGVRTTFKRWRLEEEIEDLLSLDIGIMPLSDSLWARGKCGYKILQYMGVGVPVVASPVGVNGEYIRPGENGFLAATLEDWTQCLDTLIQNPAQRRALGLAGRQMVEQRFSLEKYGAAYSDIIQSLVESS
jgi:glycosyltransferase involved in cell wall biosynthesis